MREYTTEAKPLPDAVKFALDGQEFICRELSALEVSDVMMMHGKKADSPESIAFMAKFFRMVLGDDQYDEFLRHVRMHGTPDETLIVILQDIMQDMTSRPTQPLSQSSDGQRPIAVESGGGLHSRVMDRLVAANRPDLAAAVRLSQRGTD